MSAPETIARLAWPQAAFGQAIFDLARSSGMGARIAPFPVPPSEAFADDVALDRWFEAAAEYYGAEVETVETTFANVEETLKSCAPCLLRVPMGASFGVLAIVKSSKTALHVVRPGLKKERLSTADVASLLRQSLVGGVDEVIHKWTAKLPLKPKAKLAAVAALRHELVGGERIGGMWLLRAPPGSNFAKQLHLSGALRKLVWFLVIQVVVILLGFLGWGSLFDAAQTGKLEPSPLARWVLLTISVSVLEIVRSWLVGRLGVSVGSLLKRRVLVGALKMDPEAIRMQGSGGILALINESESLENAGIGSLLGVVSACISLISAGVILYRGAGGWYHLGSLLGWAILIAVAMLVLGQRSKKWTDYRVGMTNRLVERMVGHRTRMAQESPTGRHRQEDAELELYLAESARMDSLSRVVQSLPSRGWLALGFAMLLPVLWSTTPVDTGSLLLAIGGLFTAQSAFAEIAGAVQSLIAMSIAWRNAGPLFRAAAKVEPYGLPSASVQEIRTPTETPQSTGPASEVLEQRGSVLEARNVIFRYSPTAEPVLRHCSLRIVEGDRILLEGSSGGGKSTLASILAGLRNPDAGLVLHHGLDRATLGTTTWRKKVASVPQFHENHILSSSLLFNLLLGRRWPATEADREKATRVCEALGLGPLLAQMPAGLEQVVGETGWQLSHGERTRVFLARALLQDAEVILVDESFGALDPHTLRTAIDATFKRAKTLVVIAHP